MGELRDHRGRLHRLPRPLRRRGRGARRAGGAASGAAISSSSDTRWSTGTSGSSCTACGATARRLSLVGASTPSRPRSSGRSGAASTSTCSTSTRTSTSGSSSDGSRARDVSAARRPTAGLAAFEDSELDALYFFGRERDSEIVVANLIASRLTVLYGPSGVGKSSLLLASVARALRAAPRGAARRRLLALERRPAAGARARRSPRPPASSRALSWTSRPAPRPPRRLPHPRPGGGVLHLPRGRRGLRRGRSPRSWTGRCASTSCCRCARTRSPRSIA